MRKLFPAIFIICFIINGCSKPSGMAVANAINEPPTIKILSPLTIPVLQPGDDLIVKAILTDKNLIAVASWEALRASAVCGSNPYKGEISPWTFEHEMNIKFLVPSNFAGDQVLRLYAVDGAGNIASADVVYKAVN